MLSARQLVVKTEEEFTRIKSMWNVQSWKRDWPEEIPPWQLDLTDAELLNRTRRHVTLDDEEYLEACLDRDCPLTAEQRDGYHPVPYQGPEEIVDPGASQTHPPG